LLKETFMFWQVFSDLCKNSGRSPVAVCEELGISRGSVTWWKNGKKPHAATLKKIADHFGVSIAYLLGEEDRSNIPDNTELMVALFGGDGNVSPETWEKVKEYASFLKEQEDKKKKGM